jgi:integrase
MTNETKIPGKLTPADIEILTHIAELKILTVTQIVALTQRSRQVVRRRLGEINRLTWNDVDLEDKYVVLYTRKKRGGHLTPRKVPIPEKRYGNFYRRYARRDKTKPWVLV